MRYFKYSSLILSLGLLAACSSETTNSEDIKTEAIWSDIYVTSNGETSRVIAELNLAHRNGNNLKLTNGDNLRAIVGSTVKTLQEDNSDAFDIDYRAIFDVAVGDTKFTVELNRASENKVLTNVLTLPPQYQILAPQPGQLFDKTDSIEVEWTQSGAGDQFSIVMDIECKKKNGDPLTSSTIFDNVADDGAFTITLSNIALFDDVLIDTQRNCEAVLKFERKRHGQVDSGYVNNSRTFAAQERALDNIIISL